MTSFGDPYEGTPIDPGSLGAQRTAQVTLGANVTPYQQSMGAAASSTNALTGSVATLSQKVDNIFKSAGRGLKLFAASDIATLTAGVASLSAMQKEMSTLSATAAINGTAITAYSNAINGAFAKFPVSRGNIIDLVGSLTDLGVRSQDIAKVTDAALKLQAITGQNLAPGIVQLNRQFGSMDADRIVKISNAIATLGKNAGTDPGGIINFAQSIAPISRQAGVSEPATLGISTAFNRAGADGYVAANTYNSILQDLYTLTKTGSPDITKYSSFVGKSAQQFRAESAQQQITSIFNQIGLGGTNALNFVNQQGYGTRALSAIQAVAQSGGLGRYIATAQAASTNSNNLDRGAAAANSGLSDARTMIGHQATLLADSLSKDLLPAVTTLAHGFGDLLSGINAVVNHLGPIPQVLGLVAPVIASIAGLALGHVGLVGAVGAVKLLARNGPMEAFGQGRSVRTLVGQGMSEADARAQVGGFANAANVPFRARGGLALGDLYGRVSPTPSAEEAAAAAAAGPGRFARWTATARQTAFKAGPWWFNSQANTLNDAMVPPAERSAYRNVDWNGRPTPQGRSAQVQAANDKLAASLSAAAEAADADVTATRSKVEATVTATSSINAESSMARDVAVAGGRTIMAAGRFGASVAGAPFRMAGMSGKGMGAGLGLALGGQLLGSAIDNGQAGSFRGVLGSSLSDAGMGAMFGSLIPGIGPLVGAGAGALFGGIKSLLDRPSAPDTSLQVSADLAPMRQYNQELSTSSTNLANFSTALNRASGSLAPRSSSAPLSITGADIQRSLTTTQDPVLTALAGRKNNTAGTVAYLQTLGSVNSTQVKARLVKAFGAKQAETILRAYQSSPTMNPSALGSLASGTNNGNFRLLEGAAVSSIRGSANAAPGRQSSQAELQALAALVRSSGIGGPRRYGDGVGVVYEGNAKSLTAMIDQIYGLGAPKVKYDQYGVATTNPSMLGAAAGSSGLLNLVTTLHGTKGGDAVLRSAGIDPNHPITQKYLDSLNLRTAFASPASAVASGLAGQGGLGALLARSGTFSLASSTASGNPAAVQIAIEQAAASALKFSGSSSGASAALQKLADNTSGASQVILQGAATWARTLQSQKLPFMSQEQQGSVLAQNLVTSRAAAMSPNASAQSVQTYQADQQAFAQFQQQQQQRLISMGQQLDAFHVSEVRGEQDYEKSVYRSNRDFQISMVQSEQDYLKQRGRSLQDFNIQQARQAESAAESIYNPYAAVQAQSVVSGGMLVGNLEDQNQRIEQQYKQLKQLRAAGVSQNAIDTLRLADPNNAQQLNSIVATVVNNPQLVAEINKQVKIRQKATSQLTQSDFNIDFRNTVADFTLQLDRTSQDYQTAHDRAVQAQERSLSDMSTDYNVMVERSAQDLQTSMTELYGNYADVATRTFAKINKDIGKQAPELAKMLTGLVTGINQDVTAAGGGNGGVAALGPAGSSSNPITTAGTLGVNPNGILGSYNAKGKFTKYAGPMNQAIVGEARKVHIAAPGSMNANTPAGAQAYADSQLSRYGWGQDQMAPLIKLWNNESGWRYTAENASSGALGIPQALGHQLPAGYANSGKIQVDWGLQYIKSRYGSPAAASAFEFSHTPHWYAAGGVFKKAQLIGVGESGPEAVLPLNSRGLSFMTSMYQAVAKSVVMQMHTAGRGVPGRMESATIYNHQDNRTEYSGDIKVVAQDPRQMERELADRARLKRLTSPGHR